MSENIPVKDKSAGESYIKAAPFKKDTRKTAPHKHNSYFEIVFLSQGSGHHLVDHKKYEVRPPVIFFIRREQVHSFDLDNDCPPAGFVVIIKKPFIDKSVDGELKTLFTKASNHTCLYLHHTETILQLFELLAKENEPGAAMNLPVTEGLLKALLAKVLETTPTAGQPGHMVNTGLYSAYLERLSTTRPVKNKVRHYASLLNTTPQNLNAVCRKAAGLPAAEILAECIISEAKRLLLYTGNTVSEVSFDLDFKDASHFIKYFKRYTGITPQSFRSIP